MPKVTVSTVHFDRFVSALRKRLVEKYRWSNDRAANKIIDSMQILLETYQRPAGVLQADSQLENMVGYLANRGD